MSEHKHIWRIEWEKGYVRCTRCSMWMASREAEAMINENAELKLENKELLDALCEPPPTEVT